MYTLCAPIFSLNEKTGKTLDHEKNVYICRRVYQKKRNLWNNLLSKGNLLSDHLITRREVIRSTFRFLTAAYSNLSLRVPCVRRTGGFVWTLLHSHLPELTFKPTKTEVGLGLLAVAHLYSCAFVLWSSRDQTPEPYDSTADQACQTCWARWSTHQSLVNCFFFP